MITDYTGTLIEAARFFKKKEHLELSVLLYAIFFEHWINGTIRTYARRQKLSEKETIEIIREVRNESKMSWLSVLLGIPRISQTHKKKIIATIGVRNEFAHYKYVVDDDSMQPGLSGRSRAVLGDIEKTVRYLFWFDRKHVLSSAPVVRRSTRQGVTNRSRGAGKNSKHPRSHSSTRVIKAK